MPAELQDELTELEAKACSYDGQAPITNLPEI